MSKINFDRLLRFWLPAVALLLLGGCAGQQFKTEEAALMERVEAYWEARVLRDFQTVFQMESAAEPRGWLTPQGAASIGRGITLSHVRITGVRIDGDTAEAQVIANARYAVMASTGSQTFRQKVRDFWVKIDGEWYHKTHKVVSLGALKKQRERERQMKQDQMKQDQMEQKRPEGGAEAGEKK